MASLSWPLTDVAVWHPEQTVIISGQQRIDAQTLDGIVDSLICQLQQQQIPSGAHIGCSAHNSLEIICLLLACIKGGWVYAPLNPRYPIEQQLRLVDEMDIHACWQGPESLPTNVTALELDIWQPALRRYPNRVLDGKRRASLILTSGSSGHPKAVSHRLHAHLANACASQLVLPLGRSNCWLLSLPLFHIGGVAIIMRSLLNGSAVALPAAGQSLIDSLQTQPITHISLVATQLFRLLQSEAFCSDRLSLQHLMLGGGPVADNLLSQARQRGFTTWISYGMTETASQIMTGEAQLSGRLPHIDWRIDNSGALKVKGDSLFDGYYCRGTLNLPLDRDGYFPTRDRARQQGDAICIIGRMDNLFISGGENIQPEEVEQQLLRHPDVHQVMVVPLPDDEFGQTPVAIVKTADEHTLAELDGWLQGLIAGFKRPRYYLPWPEGLDAGLKPSRSQFCKYARKKLELKSA